MDKRITTILHRTRTLLRFYCRCGQVGLARREEKGAIWECPRCQEKRKIPDTTEVELKIGPEEVVLADDGKAQPLSKEAREWGEALVGRLRSDNIAVGTTELGGYYCLRIHVSDDLDEYLRLTTIDIEQSRYILFTTTVGKLTSAEQAVNLLEHVTQFARIELSGDEVSLRWLLPVASVSTELLHEVALSLIFDASLIRSSILTDKKRRRKQQGA